MSKKKSFTGSTMTLKDFHGGSIPSDLPLPSAPGLAAPRPASDHRWAPLSAGFQTRTRPGSASSARSPLDPTAAFIVPATIGRHFDDDERKPFDVNVGFVRRAPPDPVAASAIRPVTVARSDPKPRPAAAPGSATPPNAWGVRREKEAVASVDPVVSSGSSSVAVLTSRFAQASAIDKISSGRWQSKLVTAQQEVVAAASAAEEEELRVGDLGERPKLKLFPRTRGADVSGSRGFEEKQVYRSGIHGTL